MKKNGRSRLIRPLSVAVLGTVIAGATGAGSSWAPALTVEIFVALVVVGLYAVGGSESDVGAVIGRHEDERQRVIEQKAMALAMKVMYSTAFVCAVIAIALKDSYWQADVIGSCGGLAFLLGLRLFGVPDSGDTAIRGGVGE